MACVSEALCGVSLLSTIVTVVFFTSVDARYNPKEKEITVRDHNLPLIGVSFLLTGTLSEKRKIVEDTIKKAGGDIASGVDKDLDFLVCGEDQWGSSSKWKKADQLMKAGAKVRMITEDQLKEMKRTAV